MNNVIIKEKYDPSEDNLAVTEAEKRYAPVERELLAVAWALEKRKVWTLGSDKLRVIADHKPLLGLLGNRSLEDIGNPRLTLLVEKTLRWRFRVQHIAGLNNSSSDALSRFPWSLKGEIASFMSLMEEGDEEEDFIDEKLLLLR